MLRKNLNKQISSLCISTLLAINSSSIALGFQIPEVTTPPQTNTTQLLTNSFVENSLIIGAPGPSVKLDIPNYTVSDLNRLNNNDIIDYLVKLDKYKLDSDWEIRNEYLRRVSAFGEFNQAVFTFYEDESRIQAFVDTICEKAVQYSDKDTKGLTTLLEVLKTGYYVGFYREELDYLNKQEIKDKCLPAILAVQNNPYFTLGSEEQAYLITNLGRLIDATSCNVEIINNCVPILNDYYDNKDTYIGNDAHKQKEFAVYNLMAGVRHAIDLFMFNKNKNLEDSQKLQPEDTQWYGNIDEFIDCLGKYGVIGNFNDKNASLINNGLWINGYLSKFHSDSSKCNKILTEALNLYPKFSEPYLQAVSSITEEFNGIDYLGNKISKEEIKEELKQILLPKKYTFDNGKFVVIAGDRVTEEKIQRLYWASQEVKSQFFRMYGRDEPVDTGHPDDVLTAIIYNSPKEYKMNLFINGIATDNGGMYIEKEGTFYTWERTPSESRYTLEELFRHEYTHYLQSRYVVPGFWGEGIYKDNRLTWFEEGGAELVAGSTRTSNILDRESMVTTNSSFSSNPTDRFSIRELLDSKSVTSELYAYGYAFRSFLYHDHFDIFKNISNHIINNDIEGLDSYLEKLRNDSYLNDEYQQFMQKLYDNRYNLTTPLIDDAYLDNHPKKNPQEVYSTITSVARLTDVKVSEEKSEFFNTFTLKGTFTGDYYQGDERDWKRMNEKANEFLKELEQYPWSGYKTLTCYFTNYRIDSSNNMAFDVVFHGLLTSDLENKAPIAKISGSVNAITGKAVNFSSKDCIDPDGSISQYLWDFGDGTTSTEANPEHIYSQGGNYTVKLTITDNEGETSSTTISITAADYLISENEPNDTFESANGPIFHNKNVTASINPLNTKDRFYFDVTKPGKVTVLVTSDKADKMNWTIYNESNFNEYVSWAIKSGKELKNTFDAEPGRYYLSVYITEDDTCPYTINVQGAIEGNDDGSEEEKIVSLENLQDVTLDYGCEYILPATVKATMTDGSIKDVTVTWNSQIDTTKPGNYSLIGTISETDLTASLNIVVKEQVQTKEFDYLSDLNWTKAITEWGSINKDKSVDGNTITIGGNSYEKGIGLHAKAELIYNLDGKYSRFTADVGVDDEVGDSGTLVFEVFGDGKSLHYSNVLIGENAAQKIDIDITDVKELRIEVSDYDDGISSDHGSIGDAKLYLTK